MPAQIDDAPHDPLREQVLNALAGGGHQMLVSMLEAGEWQVEGNELVIKVPSSATVIDMTLGTDARRLVIATASGVAGRALKMKVIPGAVAPDSGGKPSFVQRRWTQPGRTRSDCAAHEGKVWSRDSDDYRL